MTEARKHSETEIETLFLDQWEAAIGGGRGTAVKGFLRMKNWVGPKLWNLLVSTELTRDEWDRILNAVPTAMAEKKRSSDFFANMFLSGISQHYKLDEPVEHPERRKPKAVGNVVHVPFGRTHEKTDGTDL